MRFIVIIIAGLFSFFCIDLRRFRKSYGAVFPLDSISIEVSDQKEKLKKKHRRYKNDKYKKRKFYQSKFYKLKGTNAKDSRYGGVKNLV